MCHLLGFTKAEAQKVLQQIDQSFTEALSLSVSTLSSP
jgi:hypothetical protein